MNYLPRMLLLVGCILIGCEQPAPQTQPEPDTVQAEPERVLRHVVLFSFKETSTEADIKAVEDAFRALPEKIDAIHDFEWGTNNSPEGINRGYTHCFFVTFLSEEDRAEYLPHPDHDAFGAVLRPHLESALVVDYWTQK